MVGARKKWPRVPSSGVVVRGRVFLQGDLVRLRQLIRSHPSWTRTFLSEKVCDGLGWYRPDGQPKDRACRVALLTLESRGYLALPARRTDTGGRPPRVTDLIDLVDQPVIQRMPRQVSLVRVACKRDSRVWNGTMAAHHYLGLATPVGRLLRYLVYGDGSLVAAISFTDCAWALAPRARTLCAIGLEPAESRLFVVANNRFLILPWVKVPNLASKVLSLGLRRMRVDWRAMFRSEPLVAETFVDPRYFDGCCYRAANWVVVGKTQGYRKCGGSHLNSQAVKLILLRGLTSSIQRRLLRVRKDLAQ